MITSAKPSARPGLAVFALVGAGALAACVWAPWLKDDFTEAVSGWDLHEAASGSQQWYIGDFFDAGFSPLFPGLAVLAAAILLALMALVVVMIRPPMGRGAVIAVRGIALLGAALPLVNWVNAAMNAGAVDFQWGLLACLGGGLFSAIGIWMATSKPVQRV